MIRALAARAAGVVFVQSSLLHGTGDISAFAFTISTVFPVGNDEI